MKLIKKKSFIMFVVLLMSVLMFSIPVLAAANTFSKHIRLSTIKKTCFSLGSVTGENIQIAQVKVFVNISSGTEPFTIYLESPEGTVVSFIPTKSGTYSTTNFNGESPKGTWCAWIERMDGNSIQSELIVNATIGVGYSY